MQNESYMVKLDLPFVNREKEVEAIARINIRNQLMSASKPSQASADHSLLQLPVSCQTFGSGKSMLGTHLIERFTTDRQTSVTALLSKGTFQRNAIDAAVHRFANAKLCFLDLRFLRNETGLDLVTSLKMLICTKLGLDFESIQHESLDALMTSDVYFFHFDEVDALQTKHDLFQSTEHANGELQRFYNLWEAIFPSMTKGAYVFCTATSSRFLRVGCGEMKVSSPCGIRLIVLGSFGLNHLKEIMEGTAIKKLHHVLTDSLLEAFIALLCEWSGGVPRLVEHMLVWALAALEVDDQVFSNKDKISAFFESLPQNSALLLKLQTELHPWNSWKKEDQTQMLTLMALAACKQPFHFQSDRYLDSPGSEKKLLSTLVLQSGLYTNANSPWIADERFAMTPTKQHKNVLAEDSCYLVVPKLVFQCFEFSKPANSGGMPFFVRDLLRPTTDRPATIEGIIGRRLLFILKHTQTTGGGPLKEKFKFFEGTALGDHIPLGAPTVVVVPAFRTANVNLLTTDQKNMIRTTGKCHNKILNRNDWRTVVDDLLPPNAIATPWEKSQGPDLIWTAGDNLVQFQVTLRSNAGWDKITEDLKKCFTDLGGKFKHATLVFVAPSLSNGVIQALGKNDTIFKKGPGAYILNKDKMVVARGNSKKTPLFTIPKNVSFLLLGEKAVDSLVGKTHRTLLQEFIETRAAPVLFQIVANDLGNESFSQAEKTMDAIDRAVSTVPEGKKEDGDADLQLRIKNLEEEIARLNAQLASEKTKKEEAH